MTDRSKPNLSAPSAGCDLCEDLPASADQYVQGVHLYVSPAPSGSDMDEGVVALCKRVFIDGHLEGWTGNQQRRDVQHVDAEKGWALYVANGALTKSVNRVSPLSTPSPTLTPDAEALIAFGDTDQFEELVEQVVDGKLSMFGFWKACVVAATPAIRDQAFEEAARWHDERANGLRASKVNNPSIAHALEQAAKEHEASAEAIHALKGTPPSLRSMVDGIDNILKERPETTLTEAVDQAWDRLGGSTPPSPVDAGCIMVCVNQLPHKCRARALPPSPDLLKELVEARENLDWLEWVTFEGPGASVEDKRAAFARLRAALLKVQQTEHKP